MERDRRKYPRVKIRVKGTITVDGDPVSVITRNISRTGMLLDASDPIGEFTVIGIILELPDTEETIKVNCEGVIVRVQPGFEPDLPYSLAVHFVETEGISEEKISAFVDKALTGEN
jgi:c-di-GMP-binding flagellar brake protein YcgR